MSQRQVCRAFVGWDIPWHTYLMCWLWGACPVPHKKGINCFRTRGWWVHQQVLELDLCFSSCRALAHSTKTQLELTHTTQLVTGHCLVTAPCSAVTHLLAPQGTRLSQPVELCWLWKAAVTEVSTGSMPRWQQPVPVIAPSAHVWLVSAKYLQIPALLSAPKEVPPARHPLQVKDAKAEPLGI